DQDRRTAGAWAAREDLAARRGMVRALVGHFVLPHQRGDDVESLLEARDAMIERQAEGDELGLVPAGAEPQREAAAADLVERGRHLRQERGIAEGGAGDERADLGA